MALKEAYGNKDGPYSTFQVCIVLTHKYDTATHRVMNLRRYIHVDGGTSGFGGTHLTTSWGNVDIYNTGDYGINDIEVSAPFGGNYSTGTQQAYYTSSRTYKSSTSLSYDVPRPTYTVSYNANGGINAPSSQTKTYGYTLTLTSNIPTYEGHRFLGWSESSTAESPTYLAGGSYTKNGGATLYAVWERITYKVTFDAVTNGGEVEGAGIYEVDVYHGDVLEDFPIAYKKNNEFIGWFDKADGGAEHDFTKPILSSLSLFAQFVLMANCYVRQNGTYKASMMYVRKNGQYETGVSYGKRNNSWKEQDM